MTTTMLATIAPTAVSNGVVNNLPVGGWLAIASNASYTHLSHAVNLTSGDKSATGKTLMLEVYRSANGTGMDSVLTASFTWTSYGAGGGSSFPLWGISANPDPTINFPIGPFLGASVRVAYQTTGGTFAGVGATISGVS